VAQDAMDTDDDEEGGQEEEESKPVKCYAIPVRKMKKLQQQGEALLKKHKEVWEETIDWLSTLEHNVSQSRRLNLKPKPASG
jgi:hypothetical protein